MGVQPAWGDEAVELLFSVMLCENMLLLQFAL